MGPTAGSQNQTRTSAGLIELAVAAIRIGLQNTRISRQMGLRMFAAAVTRIVKQCSRRRWSAEGPVIAHIDPRAGDVGFSACEHGHSGVVAMPPLFIYGVSKQGTGLWWHAVDLVSAGLWRDLLETRRFTTGADIAGAVCYGLDYSPHGSERDGHLSTAEAREIMAAIGAEEPKDRIALLLDMAEPRPCEQEKGQVRWPINSGYDADAETRAWGRIFGIENGWFARDRGGFLQWTQAGQDRFAAGDNTTYTEASGQSAFAF